ncbi:MAG: prephenate dehydrogenase/arogenate dehydrogenase family protein, partial [Candidatus Acidiferrales bacterium]
MSNTAPFSQVTIIGTGLIGASFGLALKSVYPSVSIVAYDKPEILQRINEPSFGWKVAEDVAVAVRGAQLVYLALPIGAAMELLPAIAAACDAETLVTDTGSTKGAI